MSVTLVLAFAETAEVLYRDWMKIEFAAGNAFAQLLTEFLLA